MESQFFFFRHDAPTPSFVLEYGLTRMGFFETIRSHNCSYLSFEQLQPQSTLTVRTHAWCLSVLCLRNLTLTPSCALLAHETTTSVRIFACSQPKQASIYAMVQMQQLHCHRTIYIPLVQNSSTSLRFLCLKSLER
jgi:hypothetical protein